VKSGDTLVAHPKTGHPLEFNAISSDWQSAFLQLKG
jgi:hypothetical protein